MQTSDRATRPAAITLRAARADEVPSLAALIASADLPPFFIEEYLDGFLVADHDGAILACGGVEIYDDCAVIRSVVAAEEARGLGLGRRLSEALVAIARSAGATEVYLFTQDAQAFWEHLGFVDVRLDDWAQPPRASWQYQFIAANQHLDDFASVHGMWMGV